jgi:hypothetical protein
MGFWDAGTHMSKKEWAVSCRRTMNRLERLKTEVSVDSFLKSELSELNTPAAKPKRRIAPTRAQ